MYLVQAVTVVVTERLEIPIGQRGQSLEVQVVGHHNIGADPTETGGASSSCQDSGRKSTKVRLGSDREQIRQCHFGGSLETAEDLAQHERQQDLQNKYRSKRPSLRPQPEDNEGFGHSGILVLYF